MTIAKCNVLEDTPLLLAMSLMHYAPIMYCANYCRCDKPRLPVPSDILCMFGGLDKPCEQDDPSLHEGRIRSFAHERGNWASLVYIPRNLLLFYLL